MLGHLTNKEDNAGKQINTRGAIMSLLMMGLVFSIVWVAVFEPFFAWR